MSSLNLPFLLPSAMEQKLRQIRRRLTLLAALRAIAWGAAALIISMLMAMIADWWFTLFEPGLRTALTAGSLLAAAVVLIAAGVPSLITAWRWTQAAASADSEVPQLEERWTTVTLCAISGRQPTTPTAKAMLEQVTSEAVAIERLVQPGRVARPASSRPAALALTGSLVVMAGFLALDWPQTSVLLRRFWSPWAPITATQLRSLTGDQTIPRGQSLELVTQLAGVARHTATLEIATGKEIVDRFLLRPDPHDPSTFVHRLNVQDSFRYRVHAGDDRTDWHTVTAIDFPSLAEVQWVVTPPDYVNRPPYEKTLIPSRVKVIEGSRLELRMKPSETLTRLELVLTMEPAGSEQPPVPQVVALKPAADGWYQFHTQLLHDMTLAPTLLNRHGLASEEKHLCRIDVVQDKAPVARILNPDGEMVVTSDNVIDIKFEAHDDHGIAAAELVIYDESGADDGDQPAVLAVQPIPLDEEELGPHVLSSTQLDLNKLGLQEGALISYAIRVTDNRQVKLDGTSPVPPMSTAQSGEPTDVPAMDALAKNDASQPSPSNDVRPTSPPSDTRMDAPTAPPEKPLSAEASDSTRQPAGVEAASPSSEPRNSVATAPDPARGSKSEDTPEGTPGSRPQETRERPNTTDSPSTASQVAGQADPPAAPAKAAQAHDRPASLAGQPMPELPEAAVNPPSDDSGKPDGKKAGAPGDDRPSELATTADRNPDRDPATASESNPPLAMTAQQSESGQNTETNRRKLKIVERLAATAASSQLANEAMPIRERVVHIDEMLSVAEQGARKLVDHDVADADRSRQFGQLDSQLGDVETEIAALREETKDHQFAFVGLQMVDIGRSHVTPARERAFIGIREPLGSDNASLAMQQIVRARELLAALLTRYDRAERDRQLAQGLDEAVKMYEVYVEKAHQLMREARQTTNPLKRKMAVVEVEQEYLDRYAEVLSLRREMMAELARLLGDDPRLLARYLDLTRRRRTSLRDQLAELAGRQDELAAEVMGWLDIGDDQRDVLWQVVAEMRLQAATPLAKDAATLAEGIEKQLPLVLESDRGTPALVVQQAREIASSARQIAFDAGKLLEQGASPEKPIDLTLAAEALVDRCSELEAALDQLQFEHDSEEEVASYVVSRLLELRTVADQADNWLQIASQLRQKRFHGLAEIDQHKLAIATELLRVAMLDMQNDLEAEFQQQADSSVPGEISELVLQLQGLMETITFQQASATFAMAQNRLEAAAAQQAKGLETFEQAENLFDKIRRAVIDALDEYDAPAPNIADLVDPTLDEFLARLEREPNIEAQLGIPNRPRNLRMIADSMTWQEDGGDLLGQASDAAAGRARQAMRQQPRVDRPEKPETELSEEEREQRAKAQQMQADLEKSLAAIAQKAANPDTPPDQRRQLEQMADKMKRMLAQAGQPSADAEQWERIAESDKARSVLRALAMGQSVPDDQWNKLLSTLEDGLWQVRGRTPPEEYRKAIEQYQEYLRQSETGGDGEE